MGVNSYFVPRRTNRPHATPNYGPGKSKFDIDYYRQTDYPPEKLAHIKVMLEKSGQEVMYPSKNSNSNYMDFLVLTHVIN